ncbi:MAG: hypothetical protein IJO70_08195 [Lachnospiraceae bacterium]|nr:hypothetical protein [Lachnospiraceae bacterium]
MKKIFKRSFIYILASLFLLCNFVFYIPTYASEFDLSQVETDENDIFEDEARLIAAANDEHNETISYYVHQQSYGDTAPVGSGEVAGNCGTNKRLEAFYISRTTANSDFDGSIRYCAHSQSVGWTDWVTDGKLAGTSGRSKRMEALKIELTGELAESFDIYYKTYMSNCGWLEWAKNGEISGTVGYGATIEGVQILLVLKGSVYAPKVGRYSSITSDNMNDVMYSGHVQTFGDLKEVKNGALLGTTGKSKRMEAIKIRLSHGSKQMYGTINYKVHCQTYGWKDVVKENTIAGTKGESKRLEAISIYLTGDIGKYCDVYYRTHCQTFGWLGWSKNGQNSGSAGYGKRIEAIQIKILPKGSGAPGSTVNNYRDKYNTNNTEGYYLLEPYLDKIISECTNSAMTENQKLRACYDYVIKNYTYKTLTDYCPSNFEFHEYYAYLTVTTGSGNCYGMNFLFGHLAKKLGYDVNFYKGYVGTRRDPHGWVEIEGLIYDPELEQANGVDLFARKNGIMPYIYYYN